MAQSLRQSQRRLAWVFLAPSLALFAVVALYPLMQTFLLSLTSTNAFESAAPKFIGLENFRRLAVDADFRAALKNTLVFTVISVTLETALGLAVALFLNMEFRGRALLRAALLVPWAIPTVVAARIWNYVLNESYGVLNDLLQYKLHIISEPIAWTANYGYAMASVIAADVWKTTPFVAILVLAGLQTIPGELYEAAEVDGAGAARRLTNVTLPLLTPTLAVMLIFRTMDALRIFDLIWIMTSGQFGTQSIGTFDYRTLIVNGDLGYGSAVSVAIFAVLGIFIAAYLWIFRLEEKR
ncbi:sugar ABC transporter permease [soil metagenome]